MNEERDLSIVVDESQNMPKPLSMKKAFAVVLSLHVVAIVGIFYFSTAKKSQAAEDKKFLEQDKNVYVGIDIKPTPTPAPTPVSTPKPRPVIVEKKEPDAWPNQNVKQEIKTWPNTKKAIAVKKHDDSYYTKEYVVKQGDTFNKIVEKYKLNADKLKQINNIQNENTIKAGQILKLM